MNLFSSNIIFFLAVLLPVSGLDAQKPDITGKDTRAGTTFEDNSSGSIWLHIDRKRYVAGEDIWFSIYNISNRVAGLNDAHSVVYTELLNPCNVPVVQKRFQIASGRGAGHLTLPDTLTSGTYTIRAYTSLMKNIPAEFVAMYDIELFNPFSEKGFFRREPRSLMFNNGIRSSDEKAAAVIIADSVYGRREKVTLNIHSTPGRPKLRDLSLSVVSENAADTSVWSGGGTSAGNSDFKYGSEDNGHFLSGLVKYRDPDNTHSSSFLYMSVQGKVAEFRYADIDSSGRFTFILPVDSKTRNLILQPDHADNNMILEIESPYSGKLPFAECRGESFTDSLLRLFSGLSFNYQASRIYGTEYRKDAEAAESHELKKRRFYGIPEMEIFLDEYIKLPTMQEVFFELVPGIIIRSGRSGYEIKITNPLTGVFFEEKPLVMIDGVIINDLNVLVDLDPDLVEKIEVVKTPYLIGDLILQGIVNVITRQGDFSAIEMPDYAVLLPYRVAEQPPLFISSDYSDDQLRLGRTPDLRNTLYWDPSVITDKNGEALISFWTSDLPGRYIVVLKGFSEAGELIFTEKSFMVR